MIDTPTVLVLGAGASEPYGFPIGKTLLEKVLNIGQGGATKVAEASRRTVRDVDQFREALRFSGSKSIDAFLEGRSEFLEIGKASIAATLIPHETPAALFRRPDGDWYTELLDRMGGTVEQFQRNQLSIITFNYDRSVEHFLLTAVENRFGVDASKAAQMVARYAIIHLHGQLGTLAALGPDPSRPYEPELTPEAIRLGAAGIRIVHEDIRADPRFQHAERLICEAEIVYFLGFGYHPTNLQRIGLAKRRIGPVFGTAYGLEDGEVARITEFVQRISGQERSLLELPVKNDVDVLTFLRRRWITKLEATT